MKGLESDWSTFDAFATTNSNKIMFIQLKFIVSTARNEELKAEIDVLLIRKDKFKADLDIIENGVYTFFTSLNQKDNILKKLFNNWKLKLASEDEKTNVWKRKACVH